MGRRLRLLEATLRLLRVAGLLAVTLLLGSAFLTSAGDGYGDGVDGDARLWRIVLLAYVGVDRADGAYHGHINHQTLIAKLADLVEHRLESLCEACRVDAVMLRLAVLALA